LRESGLNLDVVNLVHRRWRLRDVDAMDLLHLFDEPPANSCVGRCKALGGIEVVLAI
jgi:hypothetical protein